MTELTVATLNLRGRQERWRQRRHLVVAEILDHQPDLLSLQEISMPGWQGPWLRNQVNSRLAGERYHLILRRRRHPWYGYLEGLGILSRLPIVTVDHVNLGYGGRLALRANVELPAGQTVDFVAVQLHPPADEPQARHEQALRLVSWLHDQTRVPCQILAGDFNETPDGLAIQQLTQAYRSVMVEGRGAELPATYPTALISDWTVGAGCLDYIFASPGVGPVRAAQLIANRPAAEDETLFASDHVGLLARLAIPVPR